MIGGIAATMAFNVVDTYFIGQLGAAELAAIAISNFLGAAVAYIWNKRIFTQL